MTPGIIVAAPESALRHRLWAGHLLGGPASSLGGWAALAASGMEVRVHDVAVWVPAGVRRADRPGWFFREDGAGRLDHVAGTLPRIRTDDALLDVGQELGIEGWVTLASEAVRERRTSAARLTRTARGRTRLRQRTMLLAVLGDLSGVESTLEWLYRRDVERAHGLPEGRRQMSLSGGTRSDVCYDAYSTIAEVDGRCHAATQFRDAARDNVHAALGQITLRYGTVAIRVNPCLTARQVAAVLRTRGWRGDLTRCPSCPD